MHLDTQKGAVRQAVSGSVDETGLSLVVLGIRNMTDILAICLVIVGLSVIGDSCTNGHPRHTGRTAPGGISFGYNESANGSQEPGGWINRFTMYKPWALAPTNLRWHLIFTCLFCVLVARAFTLDRWWLRLAASLLTIPSIAYALGSLVQRQKIAVMIVRSGLVHDKH